MNSAAQGAGSYKDVSMKDKQAKMMIQGGRHPGMRKQLQLPGAEIVKALQEHWANA